MVYILTHRRRVLLCFSIIIVIIFLYIFHINKVFMPSQIFSNAGTIDFSHFDNVTGLDFNIVPNVVHYVHFENIKLSFVEAVSIRSVYNNHKPDKIIIHCDCYSLTGKYWNMVKNISNLEVRYMEKQTHIFGKPLSSIYHTSDIARMKILMSEGGIFLDSDTYVIKNLDYYRRFEIAIGWPPGQNLGTQVIIAHKDARFLKLWFNSYRYYRQERWYYNAGELPTKMILERQPGLVHRVSYDFGVHNLVHMLYGVRSEEWKNYCCIHLLIRHKNYLLPGDSILEFDDQNIKQYNKTFGDMARLALYGTTEFMD